MEEFNLGRSRKFSKGLQALPRVFFGLFYRAFAGKYDLVTRAISMGLWNTWLGTTMTYLEGPQILELGSGPGHLQKILRGNGIVGMGLDESQQMLEITRMRLKRMGQSSLLVRAIGEAIPFPDSTFDQVVATFPAEFITDQDTLADIYRVLKGDGELVILRFAWLSDRHWPYKLTAWLFRLVGEAPNPKRPLQVERLVTPFRKAGFSVEIKKIELDSSGLILLLCRK